MRPPGEALAVAMTGRHGVLGRAGGLLGQVLASGLGAAGATIVVLVVLAAALAPVVAPYDPLAVSLERKLAPPSFEHWMGTDQAGRVHLISADDR